MYFVIHVENVHIEISTLFFHRWTNVIYWGLLRSLLCLLLSGHKLKYQSKLYDVLNTSYLNRWNTCAIQKTRNHFDVLGRYGETADIHFQKLVSLIGSHRTGYVRSSIYLEWAYRQQGWIFRPLLADSIENDLKVREASG